MSQETAISPERAAKVKKPVVYGYLRLAESGEATGATLAELEVKLLAWCEREGWQLGATFRDLEVGPEALIRPGFAALLDVLAMPNTYAAIVLDVEHLSSLGTVAKRMRSSIRRTGSKLLIRQASQPADGEPASSGTETI